MIDNSKFNEETLNHMILYAEARKSLINNKPSIKMSPDDLQKFLSAKMALSFGNKDPMKEFMIKYVKYNKADEEYVKLMSKINGEGEMSDGITE